MERYKNLGGDSGIAGFEIGLDYIKVQFKDGAIYLYNNTSTGSDNIQHMKGLAVAGQGLNSFISKLESFTSKESVLKVVCTGL